MAILRERPYSQFNFLVNLGDGKTDGVEAGFQEVSGIGMEITVAEYRNGNELENSVRKINGLNKSADITLKRGLIGSLNLYKLLNDLRNGTNVNQNPLPTVVIQLQNEDHSQVVMEWRLLRSRITKYTCGPLSAKWTEVAMEEMTIVYERLEMPLS